jgi:hypothetical protein
MGRWLEAVKSEIGLPARRDERPSQDDRGSPVPFYGENGPGAGLSRAELQALLQAAALQGAEKARREALDRETAAHHAHSERMMQVALAAVNRESGTRYRGSAYDKRMRRRGELRFVLFILGGLVLAIFIAWVHDGGAAGGNYKHYERYERYDRGQ